MKRSPPAPPALASWVLELFAVDEELIGDLLEEYRHNRSRRWFWRQTIVAAIGRAAADVRGHKLLAVRALCLGWVLASIAGAIKWPVVRLLSGAWAWQSEMWLNAHMGFPVVPVPILLTTGASAGLTGWVVARLHRPRAMPMLIVYMASVFLFDVAGFVNSLERGVRSFGTFGLVFNSLFPFLLMPACTLFGGLLSDPRRR